ncbi:hypothetical protein [Lysinibacillus sp. BPa_S21]|uniref:DUF6843 domain-containing protein n=1 Tax=Lysinibacillus sp. BPa_S21 TaxID=2932478 RepID=UPI002012134A|nr:hypothetical protein [Lysinibacillus sp. BPa_S21]MCL1698159.1 hypothetical protein [Lysinibacillus sp. BPa_S21]
MKKIISGMIVGIAIGFGLYWIITHKVYDEAFYFPKGYEGCAYVVYNIEGTPQLEIEDNTIQYHFDEDGLVLTTSPQDFGWEGKENSGFHDVKYFYVNENGEKINEIPESEIGFVSLGSYSQNGRIQITMMSIPVGDTAKACDEKYEELEEILDKKLKTVE